MQTDLSSRAAPDIALRTAKRLMPVLAMNNTMMTKKLIEDALAATQCIISVMGDHAGEGVDKIFKRKIADITKINRTFW